MGQQNQKNAKQSAADSGQAAQARRIHDEDSCLERIYIVQGVKPRRTRSGRKRRLARSLRRKETDWP
jgi:hypothetical protein